MKNVSYAAIYDRDFTDEYESLRALREQAQTDYEDRIRAEQKRRQPRARVRFKPLPDDVMERLRDEVLSEPLCQEINRLETELEEEKERREKLLEAMAPQVAMKPDDAMHRVKTSSSYTYSTQGYGAMKYARGVLEPIADHLERLGFEVYIRQVNFRRGTGSFATDHADYELWASCPPWMFDAAYRRLTLDDAVASMKRRCLNPRVYNPFLPEKYWL
jgi:hypothetical protein